LIVVFDGGSPAERMELLPSYKSNRKPMPDELRLQLPLADEFLDRAGVRRLRVERQEADDLIATLAAHASQDGAEVLISTADKDLYQLVGEQVSAVEPTGQHRRIGVADVLAKMGVGPAQIVDWLALTGDSSDNIPGVPGIGAKTAQKLLAQFGSLDALLARSAEVENPRVRNLLEGHRDAVVRNRALVQLRRDLSLEWPWMQAECRAPDMVRLQPFLEAMEFSSLISHLAERDLFDQI
jgi:DNA polymerase-1